MPRFNQCDLLSPSICVTFFEPEPSIFSRARERSLAPPVLHKLSFSRLAIGQNAQVTG